MKKTSGPFSELNPPENMTPSVKTITSVLLVLIPIFLFFLNLFTGFIKL
ncbi:purine permease [Pleurocapsa sp. CCALA 161]|nr:purine permease [Pleurocapsa sp. CCALA 161]